MIILGEHQYVRLRVSGTHQRETQCTVCGYVKTETAISCSGGESHSSGGKCSKCGQKYITHTETTTYTPYGSATHKIHISCSVSGCVVPGNTSDVYNCSGGAHPNGTCDYCGQTYQTHGKGAFSHYTKTDTTHTAIYNCTYSSCGETYTGTAEEHKITYTNNGDGTHSGVCTVCGNTVSENHTYGSYIDNKDGTHSRECSKCHFVSTENHTGGTHDNDGKCITCTYQYQTHKATTTVKEYTDKTETTHTPVYTCSFPGCTSTFKGTAANHTGGTHQNNGVCQTQGCGHTYQTHKATTTVKEYTDKTETTHTPVYTCSFAGCTSTFKGTAANHTGGNHQNKGVCQTEGCGHTYQTHTATTTIKEYTDKTKTTHTPVYTCSFTGCTSTFKGTAANHTGGTHDNDGKCTVCQHKYQTHEKATSILEYVQHETLHIAVHKCTEPSCDKLYTGLAEYHKGATHENDGKCTVCKYQYQIHGVSDEFARYEITETGHTKLYKCTFTGCDGTHKVGEEEAHKGGTHDNDGICTVCSHQYQIHGVSDEFARYEITETGHTELYKCTFSGCQGTHKVGEEEPHEGGTHENDGICTVCDHQYQIHGVSNEQVGYYKTETGHTKLYKCTFTGCEGTHKVGEEQPHEGGTHQNDGICTICSYKYQTHEKTTEIARYMVDETVHLVLYKCSHPGCTTSYPGTAEDHKGGTHENGGKCTVCEYQYQAHNAAEEVAEYVTTETGHTPKYKCTYEGCEGTHLGKEELHKGGTHDNDGKCTVCEKQYQKHGKSNTIKEYKPTENGHKPIYGCTHTECTETYEGQEEAHTGATHDNGGKCTKCGKQYETHEKSETVKEYKPTDNGHKPIYECTHPDCEETFEGEEKSHNVEEWTDQENGVHSGECTDCGEEVTEEHNYGEDGICEDCGARVPAEKCEHTYKIEKNERHHWNFCPKCETAEEGSLELHKYEKYTVNEDGTHSAICTVCEYKLTEKHNYGEDGKCEDCDTRIPAGECEHDYEMKHDEKQHWNFCPKCETIENGTKENHTFGKYVDNGDGTHSRTCTKCNYKQTEKHNEDCEHCKENESTPGSGDNATGGDSTTGDNTTGDNTTANKEIPKAGMKNIILALIVSIGALAIVTTFKMKKYKDI